MKLSYLETSHCIWATEVPATAKKKAAVMRTLDLRKCARKPNVSNPNLGSFDAWNSNGKAQRVFEISESSYGGENTPSNFTGEGLHMI